MTEQHHTRAHAAWSASATARNWQCSGALAFSALAPPDVESEAAAWGTACHQISEFCLRDYKDAGEFLGMAVKTEKFEFEVDEEMVDCVTTYVDYCLDRQREYTNAFGGVLKTDLPPIWVEHKFSFADLDPPFESGGTGDCIIYFPKWKMLEIVDLKGGRGVVVEVKGNPQARSYALGAMLEFKDLDVEIVRSTIVQPRAPHKDGRIRSEEIHVSDLVEWTHELMKRMRLAKQAEIEFETVGGNKVLFDEWAAKWLSPGKCTFCPNAGYCPALKKDALKIADASAQKWFDEPSTGEPLKLNTPLTASDEELEHILDGLEALENWANAVRAHAHTRAQNGAQFANWILADKIGRRAYLEKDDAKLAALIKTKLALTDDQIFEKPEVRSLAQLEKAMGSKRKKELEALKGVLWDFPVRGTNLVSREKTTRPEAKSNVETHFETVKE